MPDEVFPSDVDPEVGFFDRFASRACSFVSRAPFFSFCVLLVVVWAPSIFVLQDIDLWQLIINTMTTIITFLLVALLENSNARADAAVQHKLNAIAAALADMADSDDRFAGNELRAAVGLEQRESA